MDTIKQGVNAGEFVCGKPELLASQVTAQLQQWHLKQWKFKLRKVATEEYAQFVFENLLVCLGVQSVVDNSTTPLQQTA